MLACGILPPQVCHAHDGEGDSSHGPQGFSKHNSHNHRHHRHDVRHQGWWISDATASLNASDSSSHHHWKLFGLEFFIPCDGENCEDDGKDAPILVRFAGNAPAISHVGVRLHGEYPVASLKQGLDLGVAANSPLLSARSITSIPLCESARLVRSGVRLA